MFLRHLSRATGWMLLSAFVAVLSATCVVRAEATPAEKACCASMAAGCGAAMAKEHGCCPSESVHADQQVTAVSRVELPAPQQIVIALLHSVAVNPLIASERSFLSFDSRPPLAGGPSTYLRLSTLRI